MPLRATEQLPDWFHNLPGGGILDLGEQLLAPFQLRTHVGAPSFVLPRFALGLFQTPLGFGYVALKEASIGPQRVDILLHCLERFDSRLGCGRKRKLRPQFHHSLAQLFQLSVYLR
jgi:hypothetical protein